MKFFILPICLLLLWSGYALLPTLYFKYIRREPFEAGKITWTFDDGPNPVVTPQLLSLLKEYHVKATFFLQGEKVLAYPNLALKMVHHGHDLGIHCFHHSMPFFWSPRRTRYELESTLRAFRKYNLEPMYFRPPHGVVNLTMLLWGKENQKKLMLWNEIPGDWREDMTTEELLAKLLSRKEKGGVLCLHDSSHHFLSAEFAPKRTLETLEIYFSNGNRMRE